MNTHMQIHTHPTAARAKPDETISTYQLIIDTQLHKCTETKERERGGESKREQQRRGGKGEGRKGDKERRVKGTMREERPYH